MEKLSALHVEKLWWRYPTFSDEPGSWLLRDISFHVEEGECFGIVGASGAGKTTLCRTLLGILPHSAHLNVEQLPHHFRGSIKLFGEAITHKTSSEHQIGMVLQDPENQFLRMSLLHELAFGLQLQGLPHEEIVQRISEALRWVGLEQLWPGAAYLHPTDLSGGQKQRVAIAAFLALRPRVLILDEPTSDLDPVGKREVIETLARLRRDYQMTVILVEQDPEILAAFCDRIALLHKGRVELVAPPATFYTQKPLLEEAGAPASELVRISWGTGYTYNDVYNERPPLTLAEGKIAFAPLVTALNPAFAEPAPASPQAEVPVQPQPVVQAEQVYYRYDDGSLALKGIDFTLYRGEMLALLGPNGSGKTTFAKILAGLYRASSGKIAILGRDLGVRRVRKRISSLVGYVFQNPDHQLFCRKVYDEIEYGLKNLDVPAAQRSETIRAVLEAVNLSAQADEDPVFLSKGERQRLAVAAVLAMGAEILVVDEPTTGQDSRSIAGIMHLLNELQRQGKTIVIITHDMTLVAEYCQRVVSFRNGLVSFTGTPEQLFSQQELLAETGLRAPISATLANEFRARQPELPPLLTSRQWIDTLMQSSQVSTIE